MLFKRLFFVKSLFILLVFECTLLTITNGKSSSKEVSETDLERMALNFMSMIEFKLKKYGKVNEMEIRLLSMLMKEIEKRIEMEREREENTVYWHLRQG
jgi:hypothetical protein